jgi:hypothetical protein
MKVLIIVVTLAAFLPGISGCGSLPRDPAPAVSAIELDGAVFEIADAAIASNCLSITLRVRGFRPEPGIEPRAYFPPAKQIVIRVDTPDSELTAAPLGGGGGGGGDEEDGRIWMEQQILHSLSASLTTAE